MTVSLLRLKWLAAAHRTVIPSIFAASALLVPISASAFYITGEELVGGSIFTPRYTDAGVSYGPFGLNFSYVRSFDGARVEKDVQINFAFDAALGYDAAQQAAYRAKVEANIEGIWNNKYMIVDRANNKVFPVGVDVTTIGPRFDQTIAVHPGFGRANALNWFVSDSGSVNAHEFGHLLGLFDEYIGGGIDRYPNPTLSDTGLMGFGALSATPEMFPRYYEQYFGYITELNPHHTFELNPVPEPATLLLFGVSAAGLGLARWRRRKLKQAAGTH